MKLTENSFRDVNIALANELSLVCDHLGINVRELIKLANHHPRVNVLQPGCGVGGHCIAVDPWFIAAAAPHCTPLIQTARRVNDGKSRWVIEKVKARAAALEDELGRPAASAAWACLLSRMLMICANLPPCISPPNCWWPASTCSLANPTSPITQLSSSMRLSRS